MGFLKQVRRGDYSTASLYMQSTPETKPQLESLAKELQELTDTHFQGNLDFLSERPEGKADDALPLDRESVGIFVVGNSHVKLILTRVDESKRKIWLISKETITEAHILYSQRPVAVTNYVPESLMTHSFLSISVAKWIALVASLPAAYYLSWVVLFIFQLFFRGVIALYRNVEPPAFREFHAPIRLLAFLLLHTYAAYLARIPLYYRWIYIRFLLGLYAAAIVWLLSRGVFVFFENSIGKLGAWAAQRGSMLTLVSRMIRMTLVIVGVLAVCTAYGLDTKAMLTGVGIGGLAIALAGQKTIENVIGGVSLLLDRAVHVGDVCRINDRLGTVEDIGLRSVRLRALDQTLLVVPNGLLAQVQFENLSSRTKLLIQDTFKVRSETEIRCLQGALKSIKDRLDSISYVERSTSRIRISRFSGTALEIELFVYVLTGDWQEFTCLREEIIFEILEIFESAGVQLAGTTQLIYFDRSGLGSSSEVKLETLLNSGEVHVASAPPARGLK